MLDFSVEQQSQPPLGHRAVEYVERKGLGHPDSICDAVMEEISIALSAAYVQTAGRVLHHNVDKGLLVAGQSTPKIGGGTIDKPMRLVVGDRATNVFNGRPIPVGQLAEAAARSWLKQHLRFVDPAVHLIVQNELHPGSAELIGIFSQPGVGSYASNDTSAAVGFAPLSETEQLVLETEKYLNSAALKQSFPEIGEDIKVMGVRRGTRLHLTVAAAMVDRFVAGPRQYFERKEALRNDLLTYLHARLCTLEHIDLGINMLDDPDRGEEGMYLTVLGTSAESGDGGQVGRGNRVNGLISLCRPMTLEAAAGKNPISHVGKIYNQLAHQIAHRAHRSLDAIEEVTIWLCSQIGRPVNEPWFASAQVALAPGATLADIEQPLRQIVADELSKVGVLIDKLCRGELPVC